MKRILTALLFVSLLTPLALADEGMWTFDNPPLKQWKERYNFEPSKEWLDKVRLASPKLPGASGAFVSPNGLIATNHHVASSIIAKLSTKERDLMKTGFYAKTQAEELKAQDSEASVLVSFENVTDRVHGVAKGVGDAEASAKRTAEIAAIEKECVAATSLKCDIVSLYSGGEYWLYRNKRYTDIRLVMAPEEQAAFFGGDYDNFVYPRHDLDFTFLRVYENGQPAKTPHYFKWSTTGAPEGEFIIASGYPGSTARLLTIAQLAYQRDVGNPLQKKVWETQRKALEAYSKRGAEQLRQAMPGIRSFANSLKRLTGQQEGLLNPRNFARKEAEEKDLREKLAFEKPELNKLYAPAWDKIAKAYTGMPSMAAFSFSTVAIGRLGTIASQIVTYHIEKAKPNERRYPEYTDSRFDAFKRSLVSPAPIYPEMEEAVMLAWLEEARKTLGGRDEPFIKAALGDADVAEMVRRAYRETKLNDPAVRQALLEGPADAVANSTDPMIMLARRVESFVRIYRDWSEINIKSVETSAGTDIAKARFAVYGRSMPPDANGQLRISYGTILGYEEDTTLVPYKTTFFGLYDRALSFGEKDPFHLPQSIKDARSSIDLATPLNFVYTADTIGGNSGSPVITREGFLVGLNFDSNIQKLSNRYWYIEEAEGSRAVGVHSAGIIEALRKIYKADGLVKELLG